MASCSFGEVLAFFHSAGGVEATAFVAYAKPVLLSIPLTMTAILDRNVFDQAFLKKRLGVRNAEHASAILGLRDKVTRTHEICRA